MASGASPVSDIDLLRSRVYALLAQLLARPPAAGLLCGIARLAGDDTRFGQALAGLAAAAAAISEDEARREYETLFIGVVRGEVVPYGSYYLTGFLNDRPLGRLRRDLDALGIERASGVPEPEDHLASLCEVMSGLITGSLGTPAEQSRFFDRHLRPWAGRCFADIENAPAARLYHPLGRLGRLFIDIETEGFALPAEPREPASGGLSP